MVSLLHHFLWALVWVIFCLFQRCHSSRLPCVNTRSITKPLNKYSTSKYCFATYTPPFLNLLLKYQKIQTLHSNTHTHTHQQLVLPSFSVHFDMHPSSQRAVNYLLTMFARRKNITLKDSSPPSLCLYLMIKRISSSLVLYFLIKGISASPQYLYFVRGEESVDGSLFLSTPPHLTSHWHLTLVQRLEVFCICVL